MNKRQKIKQDQKELKRYEKRLRQRRQEIGRQAESWSLTGRKQRIAAIGESVLKLLDDFNKQQADLNIRGKKMLDGTLFWLFEEQKVKDTDGNRACRAG